MGIDVHYFNIANFLVFTGTKRGYLRKKGKKDNNWNVRLFVLSEAENTLRYYIEDQVTVL